MMKSEQGKKLVVWSTYAACLVVLGVGQAVLENKAEAQRAAAQGYVLSASEGETLVRPGGNIVIKVDPTKGSAGMAMGTQHLKGGGIPVHRHEQDEILFIQEGGGTAVMGESRQLVEKGTTIFIPKGVWHGVENAASDTHLLWIVTPPGLEGFFREISGAPGAPPKPMTPEQRNEIARKHGTTFRP